MIKKAALVLLTAVIAALLFSACSSNDVENAQSGANDYTDFIDSGKVIGVQSGEIFNLVARDLFKAREVPEFMSMADLLEALRMGRVDAAMTDGSYVKQLEDSGMFPEFDYLWIDEEFFVNKSAPVFHSDKFLDKYNSWLAEIKADGTYDEMLSRWIGVSLPDQDDVPVFELTGENGVLRVCDTGNFPPFIYYDADGAPTGLDYELINRFALHIGVDLEISMMAYDAIIPYVISGKADMSSCYFTITDERGESVLFGDPTIVTRAVLIVPSGDGTRTAGDKTDYFKGKDIAVITGALTYNTTEKIGASPVNYNDSSSAAEDVRKGRVAGYMHALTAVQVMAAQLDGFETVPVSKDIFSAQVAAISHDQDMIDRFNAFLSAAETDGTLEDMKERWFGETLDLDAPIPEIQNPEGNGALKVAVCSDSIPYVYVGANGNYSGFSTELMLRFGAYEGKTVEFTDMEFGGLIPYIVSQKADFGIANMAITEERKQSVLFTDPFFDEQHGILCLKGSVQAMDSAPKLDYTDFIGKRFAVKNGTIYDGISRNEMQSSETLLFEDYPSIYEAVQKGRADAGMRGYYAAYVSLFESSYSDLDVIAFPDDYLALHIGAISMDQDVIDVFNEFLAAVKADGTYDEMKARWFDTFDPGNIPDMPEIPLTCENGKLTVAISSDYMPFCFLGESGLNLGFDIELSRRFASYTGKDLVFADMAFSGLLPYIISGKADIAVSDITITDERKQSVLFTDSYMTDLSAIVFKRDFNASDESETGGGFIGWLKSGVERNLITDNRWKMIVNGLGVTMIIAFSAQILGTALGCFVCYALMRKNRFAKWLANLYCGLIHGTPVVVLLMITYYIIFGSTSISNVFVAVVAFTMVTGATVAQTLKGAIDTIDPVEVEAARSIGFSAFMAFLTVTLPQAVRRALPGYTNGFVELVKATAIVGYIAIQDLTRAGDIIRSRTYDAYFPLLLVAVIYLIMTTACILIFKHAVKKINGGEAK